MLGRRVCVRVRVMTAVPEPLPPSFPRRGSFAATSGRLAAVKLSAISARASGASAAARVNLDGSATTVSSLTAAGSPTLRYTVSPQSQGGRTAQRDSPDGACLDFFSIAAKTRQEQGAVTEKKKGPAMPGLKIR